VTHTAKLVWITPKAEALIAEMARVSSNNQNNPEYEKLFKYLIKHGHWSPFEMASMCVEVQTTRAITPQILRHRSFSFQEFSQRYAEVQDVAKPSVGRLQGKTNRQGGEAPLTEADEWWWWRAQTRSFTAAQAVYGEALRRGVAKEVARSVLPLATPTRLYMSGTLRSWIHYLQLRTAPGTQKEHRLIAESVRQILDEHCPVIAKLCLPPASEDK
jgi:thymidylate synthase (FAD)